uniref:Retrotransposon Copia-like N-terminal domain-containing protein n=1 Tax=Solanum tuberosum TaxID=4113 RepID=M1DAE8_SOLTU
MVNVRVEADPIQPSNNGQDASMANTSFNTSSVQGQGIDYNHPLFLSPSDVSGISIISFQLLGVENYTLWHRSIRLALLVPRDSYEMGKQMDDDDVVVDLESPSPKKRKITDEVKFNIKIEIENGSIMKSTIRYSFVAPGVIGRGRG